LQIEAEGFAVNAFVHELVYLSLKVGRFHRFYQEAALRDQLRSCLAPQLRSGLMFT
jgi:hypothetical protein